MGSQLALKSRIASTASLEKIFNAQEMIASSHIAKARDVALNAKPYTDAIFDAVQALPPVYAFRGQKAHGNQGFSVVVDGVAE